MNTASFAMLLMIPGTFLWFVVLPLIILIRHRTAFDLRWEEEALIWFGVTSLIAFCLGVSILAHSIDDCGG